MKKKMKKAAKAKFLSILSIVLVVICAFTIYCVNDVNGKQEQAMRNQMDYMIYVGNFGDASAYLTDEVRAYAATGDKVHYDNYWYEINTAKNRETNLAKVQAMGLTAEEQAMVDLISATSNNLVPIEEKAMEYVAGGWINMATEVLYSKDYIDGVEVITSTIDAFDASIQARMQAEVDKMTVYVTIFSVIAYLGVIITLFCQVILVQFILKELIVPIVKFRDKMEEFAQGDLNGEFDLPEDTTEIGETVRAVHEFQNFQKELIADMDYLLGQMADSNFNIHTRCEENYRGNYSNILVSLRRINRTLDRTLKDIRQAAEQVDAGSDQVACGAQALSQGATEQASSTEELAATVNDINNHVQQAGEYAHEASVRTSEAGRMTGECDSQMQQMVAAMNDISNSSQEIGKIIKTIEDIAFQTNILALNAAVEAARAGAAGKGFAVVADEVRNLAAKSAEASKNTAALIEASMTAVERGVKLADSTAEQLQQVAASTQQTVDMVTRIAATSQEQAASIQQVSVGLDQISAVVQTNSATAEESAAASEELSGQAALLKQLVGQFQLREEY